MEFNCYFRIQHEQKSSYFFVLCELYIKTELIIYLVPHWLKDQEPDTVESDEDFCERILKEHEEKLELKKDM